MKVNSVVKIIQITTFSALFASTVYGQSLSNQDRVFASMCNGDEVIMSQLLSRYNDGTPFDAAVKMLNSEDNVRARVFLKNVARQMYGKPKKWEDYRKSGAFKADCIKARNGS